MTSYTYFILRQLLRKYFKGELSKETSECILEAAKEIALDQANIYLMEITYRIRYDSSLLVENISVCTYKKMKKLVKDNLIKRLIELKGGVLNAEHF